MSKKKEKRQARERDPNQIKGNPEQRIRSVGAIDWATYLSLLSPKGKRTLENNPYQIAVHPPNATPPKPQQMAFDSGLMANNNFASASWMAGIGNEGLLFLGYSYLAELAQRPEYRVISETIADDATRKWIDFDVVGEEDKIKQQKDPVGEAKRQNDPDERKKRLAQTGKTDKVKALKDDQNRLGVRDLFYGISRDDGFFGRSHLYMNFGEDVSAGAPELKTPIGDGRNGATKSKIGKGKFKQLKVIEAVWTYPQAYNANNPLADGWYAPAQWYVMGTEIHGTRLLTFIGHPVPDLLKPPYSFG